MGLFDNWFGKNQKEQQLDEAMKAFDKKYIENATEKYQGEGISDFQVTGYGTNGLTSFNNFYNKFINVQYENEKKRIFDYRNMAQMPEISDVIEDAVIESTQEDEEDGNIIRLNIIDDNISKNKNIIKNLTDEFEELFFNRIKIQNILFDWMKSYYIDGRLYYEKILNPNNHKQGILGIKQLPSEMMDYQLNPINGDITFFVQNLSDRPKIFNNIADAEKDKSTIAFYPNQVGFINYGLFGANKKQIIGYLEKCKQPFNQLKLLETSVVIYRFIRSPERLVFKIDTGAMPIEKAMKFVQKVKEKMNQQVDFDPESGEINNKSKILSILSNFWLPQCLRMNTKIPLLDGRTLELKDLIKEYGEGKKNYTYSIDQSTGKIIKGEIEWAGITRKDAELVRVHIDNHEYVDVTPDHKFVMRNGTEVMAQDLKEGDSLMPLYTKTERINKSKSNRTNDYHMFFDLRDYKWKWSHRTFGPKPKRGYAIHHVDFNRYNNNPDNLKSMLIKEHIRYHSQNANPEAMMRELNKPEVRERQKQAARKQMIERFKNPEVIKQYSKRMKERWNTEEREYFIDAVKRPKTEDHKKSLSDSIKNKWENDQEYREKVSISSKKRWDNKDFADHMSEVQTTKIDNKLISYIIRKIGEYNFPSIPKMIKLLSNDIKFMDHWRDINKNITNVHKNELKINAFRNIITHMGYDSYTDMKENFVINHKVTKIEKLNIREDTGCLTIKDPGNNHNFAIGCGIFVKNSSDGRGSDVSSIGGNPSGFAELDDLYYFQKKLFRSLKYPMSRVSSMKEGREADILYGGNNTSEITRDEIKWAVFLEQQQNKFANSFQDLFLLHLFYKGYKKQYSLDENSFRVEFNPPNKYKSQLHQGLLETRSNNYSTLSNNPEFSKSYLMKKYLHWSDEEIEANAEGLKQDKKLGLKEEGMF